VATVGALLVSVRLIARPISQLAEDMALQSSQHHGQLQPLPVRADASMELQKLVRAFNGLAEQVSTAAAARQQLLAGVSHDLRTPLARLRLRAETQCEPAVADALTADLHALGRIVDQFLAYVQGDTGITLGTPLPLDQTVRDAVLRYAEAGQAVSAHIEPVHAVVPDLAVQRLLTNLVDNALAYGEAPVEVALRATPDGAELRVTDHGKGISAGDFERAQQPFVRLTSARSELGHCGLGLAIAAQMARQLGGRLRTLRDEEGRFVIALSLPATAAPLALPAA
jgi:two-component system, OmpR family, osmolarity sensor histidine kinase EnvZ